MIRSWLKYLLVFAAGAGAGSIITHLIVKEKYALLAQDEIDDVKEHYRKAHIRASGEEVISERTITPEEVDELLRKETRGDTYIATTQNDPPYLKVERSDRDVVGTSSLNGGRIDNPYEKAKTAYHLVKGPSPTITDAPPVDYEEELDKANEYTETATTDPYEISEMLFSESMVAEHDKLTITYYVEDDTVVEENKDLMDDIDKTLGWDILHDAADLNADVIYIRNEKLGIDYEVEINRGSYKEIVLGRAMTPREKQEIMSRRRKRGAIDGDTD